MTDERRSGSGWTLVIGGLCLCLALVCVRGALRDILDARPARFDLAAALAPPDPRTLSPQGRASAAAALATARARVGDDPLNVLSLRNLALAYAATGDTARAKATMVLAGDRSWRDSTTQAWLLHRWLLDGEPGLAFRHADALLRRAKEDELRQRVYAVLVAAAAEPQAFGALVERLRQNPTWRPRLMGQLAAAPQARARTEAVLAALKAGPTPPTDGELAPYVNQLVAVGDITVAYRAWTRFSSRADTHKPLRAGDFRNASDSSAFTWTMLDQPGVNQTVVDEAGPGQGLSLAVDYDGYSNPVLAGQLLVLPAGRYRITWKELTEAAEIGPRLTWTLRCKPSGEPVGRAADALPVGAAWQDRAMDFVVPPKGCATQSLQLAPTPGDRRTTNISRYRAFRLDRRP